MTLAHVLPLLAVWALAVIAPGPDFVAVLRTAIARGRRAGIAVGLGVTTGIACWAVLAMAGLGVLLTRYSEVYAVVRLVGATFLVVYGLRVLWHAWRRRCPASELTAASAPGEESQDAIAGGSPTPRMLAAWRLGLATNLANPKAVAFFGALFASILPPGLSVADRTLVLVAMLAMALAWFVSLAWVASTGRAATLYRRGQKALDTATGGVLTGLGIALLPR